MWLRWFVVLSAAAAWFLLIWLGGHRSEAAQVLGRWSLGYLVLLSAVFVVSAGLSILLLPRPFARIHAWRREILALLVSVVASVAGAEMAVRLIDPFGISMYEEGKRYQLAKLADAELVYRHPPNWHVRLQGVDVDTNELGLRDPPINRKPPNEYRVLLLGDSVAFGWGVRSADTLARQLEARLEPMLKRPVRVINSGVGSYNTEQEVLFLKRHHGGFAPDALVMLTVENDDDIHSVPFDAMKQFSLADKSPPEVVKLLAGRLWLYRLVSHFFEYRSGAQVGVRRDAEGWQRALRAYDAFGEFCAAKRARCTTLFYRMRANAKNTAMLSDYRRLADKRGQSLVDTGPWFEGLDVRSITNSVVDSHPNAAGHAILAEKLAALLGATQ